MFEALIEDVVTRWDSELALLERIVYFDREILQLSANPALAIPADLVLNRWQFDLAIAMTLVLDPLRRFTKFVQQKHKVTLAYVPGLIDELVSELAPNSFQVKLAGASQGILEAANDFQACLVASIRERFADVFASDSLAMEARLLLPGKNLFTFRNFVIPADAIEEIKANFLDDVMELLPSDTPVDKKQKARNTASVLLDDVRDELDGMDARLDPLLLWPTQFKDYSKLFPGAKMMFGIPCASAENERSFSSASFVLQDCRTKLDVDNFRREHRIRRFLCAGVDTSTQEGRNEKTGRALELLGHYAQQLDAERNARNEGH
jgi:hypothetical protein